MLNLKLQFLSSKVSHNLPHPIHCLPKEDPTHVQIFRCEVKHYTCCAVRVDMVTGADVCAGTFGHDLETGVVVGVLEEAEEDVFV